MSLTCPCCPQGRCRTPASPGSGHRTRLGGSCDTPAAPLPLPAVTEHAWALDRLARDGLARKDVEGIAGAVIEGRQSPSGVTPAAQVVAYDGRDAVAARIILAPGCPPGVSVWSQRSHRGLRGAQGVEPGGHVLCTVKHASADPEARRSVADVPPVAHRFRTGSA